MGENTESTEKIELNVLNQLLMSGLKTKTIDQRRKYHIINQVELKSQSVLKELFHYC
jgi:hypothetical protein